MPADYQSTARALALPLDDPDDFDSPASSPVWGHRRSASLQFGRHQRRYSQDTPTSITGKARAYIASWSRWTYDSWKTLSLPLKIVAMILPIVFVVLVVCFIVYSEKIWQALVPISAWMRKTTGAWLLLLTATILVSFPPMIGYSTCVTGAGFIYGVGKGWLIAASGTILGSTLTFVICQTLLHGFATRLAARDPRFASFSATLKHDGLKLLCMIRLCPLPYSFSNGAIATFPTVRWPQFMFATSVAAPKLMIHVFIGSRLAVIAETGEKMDFKTRCLNYAGIGVGIAIGIITGVVIYRRTQQRSREIEQEESAAVGLDGSQGHNDPRGADGISLRETPGDEDDDYRDYLTDEEGLSDAFVGADSDIEADIERANKGGK